MASEKEQWVKAGVIIAPCYPLQPLSPSHRELKSAKRKDIIDLLQPLEGKTILDAGTGEGVFAIDLALDGAHSVTALDMSEKMLQTARKNTRRAKVESKLVFIQGDIENLALRDNSYDVVVATAVLCHLPNPRKAVAEWTRILKNGGQLITDFVPLNPLAALFDPTLINPTLKERALRFLGTAINEFLSLIFGFAWRRTRLTNRLYYRFFNVPFKHHTRKKVTHLLNQNGIRIYSVKRYGRRLCPFEFRLYGKKK